METTETESFVPGSPDKRYMSQAEYEQQGVTYTQLELTKLGQTLRSRPELCRRAPKYLSALVPMEQRDRRVQFVVCAAVASLAVVALFCALLKGGSVDAATSHFWSIGGAPIIATRVVSLLHNELVALPIITGTFLLWLLSMAATEKRFSLLGSRNQKAFFDATLPLFIACTLLVLFVSVVCRLFSSKDALPDDIARLFANVGSTKVLDGPVRLALGLFCVIGGAQRWWGVSAALLAIVLFAGALVTTMWTTMNGDKLGRIVLAGWAALGLVLSIVWKLAPSSCNVLGEVFAVAVPLSLLAKSAFELRQALRNVPAADPTVWHRETHDADDVDDVAAAPAAVAH